MRLCEIIMAGRPVKPGSSWEETDFSWYVWCSVFSLPWVSNIRR